MSRIKEMVKDNKKVQFSFYRQGELWYKTECGMEFPIPISDTGTATYMPEMKAITCMRYIRKWLQKLEERGY